MAGIVKMKKISGHCRNDDNGGKGKDDVNDTKSSKIRIYIEEEIHNLPVTWGVGSGGFSRL
jgi:hypothetical protein